MNMDLTLLETLFDAYKCEQQQKHEKLILMIHFIMLKNQFLVVPNNGTKVRKKNIFNERNFFLENRTFGQLS
jgi:hypothetical protein